MEARQNGRVPPLFLPHCPPRRCSGINFLKKGVKQSEAMGRFPMALLLCADFLSAFLAALVKISVFPF